MLNNFFETHVDEADQAFTWLLAKNFFETRPHPGIDAKAQITERF
jgi:hypothetical protein